VVQEFRQQMQGPTSRYRSVDLICSTGDDSFFDNLSCFGQRAHSARGTQLVREMRTGREGTGRRWSCRRGSLHLRTYAVRRASCVRYSENNRRH